MADGRLAEYQTLRGEILQTQNLRTSIMQWTTGAIGALIVLALPKLANGGHTRDSITAWAALGAHVFLLSAILLSRRHAIHANRIGRYIQTYLENPKSGQFLPGLNWETRWDDARQQRRGFEGASRTEGIYYGIVAVAVFFLNFDTQLSPIGRTAGVFWAFLAGGKGLVCIVDAIVMMECLAACIDTYMKFDPAWHPKWPSDPTTKLTQVQTRTAVERRQNPMEDENRQLTEVARRVSNPLTVIGIFAGLAEVSGTVVLPFLNSWEQSIFVWFLMGFPVLLVGLFFAILNWNHKVLYAPSDFRHDSSFLETIRPLSSREQEARLAQAVEESTLQQPSTVLFQTESAGVVRPDSQPDVSREQASLKATVLQAEDLALKEIQADTRLAFQRDVGIEGELGLHFDALSVDREKRILTAVEVKFLRTMNFPDATIRHAVETGNALVKRVAAFGNRARFILAIVTDGNDIEQDVIKRRVEKICHRIRFHPDIRMFTLKDLRQKYGLSEG